MLCPKCKDQAYRIEIRATGKKSGNYYCPSCKHEFKERKIQYFYKEE